MDSFTKSCVGHHWTHGSPLLTRTGEGLMLEAKERFTFVFEKKKKKAPLIGCWLERKVLSVPKPLHSERKIIIKRLSGSFSISCCSWSDLCTTAKFISTQGQLEGFSVFVSHQYQWSYGYIIHAIISRSEPIQSHGQLPSVDLKVWVIWWTLEPLCQRGFTCLTLHWQIDQKEGS